MKRARWLIITLIVCMIVVVNCMPAYAHPEAREHNEELEDVLFEEGYSKYQNEEIENYVDALEAASYLTIDQFGGKGEKSFNFIKKLKIRGLPWSFEAIDYSNEIEDSEKKIMAKTHRAYTHQGWDRDYSSKGKEVNKFWNARRKVLLATVNSVFEFDKITIFGYGDKCNSMAGIIYYVHILGDYEEADKYSKISLLPDLAGRSYANDTDKDYDIITSLKGYIEILFEDQAQSQEYKELLKGLDDIEVKAAKLVQSVGGVNTDEEFEEYHQYADDTLNLLIKYMPTLLKNEKFFAKVFYPEHTQ